MWISPSCWKRSQILWYILFLLIKLFILNVSLPANSPPIEISKFLKEGFYWSVDARHHAFLGAKKGPKFTNLRALPETTRNELAQDQYTTIDIWSWAFTRKNKKNFWNCSHQLRDRADSNNYGKVWTHATTHSSCWQCCKYSKGAGLVFKSWLYRIPLFWAHIEFAFGGCCQSVLLPNHSNGWSWDLFQDKDRTSLLLG